MVYLRAGSPTYITCTCITYNELSDLGEVPIDRLSIECFLILTFTPLIAVIDTCFVSGYNLSTIFSRSNDPRSLRRGEKYGISSCTPDA